MGTLKGYSGSVTAGGTAIGEIRNYSLNISSDVQEVSTLGSAWAKNTSTLKRWTGSLEAHFDVADSGQDSLRAGLLAGTAVDVVLFAGGTSGAGNVSYSGSLVIESMDITNDVAGIVTVSISGTGNGELTEAELS